MHKANLKSLFAISIIILSTQISNAVNIEFDDVNSTASVSMAVSTYAGGNSDSNSWASSEPFSKHRILAHANLYDEEGSLLAEAFSYPEIGSRWELKQKDGRLEEWEFAIDLAGDARSSGSTGIPAGFSVYILASADLRWNIVPECEEGSLICEARGLDFEDNIEVVEAQRTGGIKEFRMMVGDKEFERGISHDPVIIRPGEDVIRVIYRFELDIESLEGSSSSMVNFDRFGRVAFWLGGGMEVSKGKEFMITFDDGPVPGNTEKIVNALKNIYVGCEPVRAGFFMLGVGCCEDSECFCPSWECWKNKGSVRVNPLIVQMVAQAGHFIGNHTQHHPCFSGWFWFQDWPVDSIKREISDCINEIKTKASVEPNLIFRPPYFCNTPNVRAAVKAFDGLQMILGAGENRDKATDIGWRIWPLPWCYWPSVEGVKKKAKELIETWKRDEPCVLVFHDISPITANNIAEIIRYLREDEGFTLVHFDPSRLPGSIPSRIQQATNSIHQSETVTHTVSLDSTVSSATFNVSWGGSDLDLVLYKPDGTKIDPNIALLDPNIKYAERDTYEYYTVSDPNPGNWVMEVSGVNVPTDGEKYTIRVEGDTNLALFAFTDKPDYGLNEHINISTQLVNDENSVTGALVTAKVHRPNGSVDNLTLYDDGTHGDEDPNDGFYANAYNNTSLRGSYEITVSAIGEITGEQYERASSLTAMVGSIIYGNVDFGAYAIFADHWMAQNCAEPAWCDTADLDQSGEVDIFDMEVLAEHWLEGAAP